MSAASAAPSAPAAAAAAATVAPTKKDIPLTLRDECGKQFYVLENDAYRNAKNSSNGRPQKQQSSGKDTIQSASMADFHLVVSDNHQAKPKKSGGKSKADQEWVMV